MTIKNTLRNISAEDGELVTKIANTAPTKDDDKSNFKTNQKLKVTYFDFYEEDNEERNVTITFPFSELVRLGYLTENYYPKTDLYTKNEVDAKIKLHYEVVSSIQDLPTAQEVRNAGKQNYIFLVPFSPDEEGTTGISQEGHFLEYIYVVDDNGQNERMEQIGSTKIDLTPYLKTDDLDNELLNCSNFTDLQDDVEGKVDIDQNIANGIVITNANKKITVASTITKDKISDFAHTHDASETTYTPSVDTYWYDWEQGRNQIDDVEYALDLLNYFIKNNNDSRVAAENSLDDRVDTLEQNLPLYELKSDLRKDVWGTTGFVEQSGSENKALGEYIYTYLTNNYYTKTYIDTTIASLRDLQQSTLDIL